MNTNNFSLITYLILTVSILTIAVIENYKFFKAKSYSNTGELIFKNIIYIIALYTTISGVYYIFNEREVNKEGNYELQLVDGTTVRDSLKETKEYFYKNDGTKFYKTNVIYSKEIK